MSLERQRARALSQGLRGIAERLERMLQAFTTQKRTPMLLIVHVNGVAQYIANIERDDAKAMMRELLVRWDTGMPDVPEHEKQ